MEESGKCKSCKKRALVTDNDTGNLVCSLCGIVQGFNNFEHNFGGISGVTGTFIKTGSSGVGSNYSYKEKKVYSALQELEHITFLLDMPESRKEKVKDMVDKVTEGEFGTGNWLPILIGACSYVVMRKVEKSLSLAEVASKVGCDVHELGRMVNRVVNFLELKLPEFDVVGSFERGFRTCFGEGRIDKDVVNKMMKQGIFLVQCLVKWWLTTGRRPLPIVVAVLIFIAQLNQVDVSITDVANKLHAVVATCRLRYKELLEKLVEVAQALPWGKDINVKNILTSAPFVIQYMELKSMSKNNRQTGGLNPNLVVLDDFLGDCFSTEDQYGVDSNIEKAKDSKYFELEDRSGSPRRKAGDMDEPKISHECLSKLYSEFSEDVSCAELKKDTSRGNRRKRRKEVEPLSSWDWWNGKSELSKKLVLKKILEKDVGLDIMPPSFVSGCLANSRRRDKIKAAKLRISKIMNPLNSGVGLNDEPALVKCTNGRKKKRGVDVDDDWEDFIIETLLLHQAYHRHLLAVDSGDESISGKSFQDCEGLAARLAGTFVGVARNKYKSEILKIVKDCVEFAFINAPKQLSFLESSVIQFASKLPPPDVLEILKDVERRAEIVDTETDPTGWRPYYMFVDSLKKYGKNEGAKERPGRPPKNQNIKGKRLFDESSSSDEDPISVSDQDAQDEKEEDEEDDMAPPMKSLRSASKLRSMRVTRDDAGHGKSENTAQTTENMDASRT